MSVMASEDFVMPWGKHQGKRLASIPSDYLRWLAENCNDDSIASMADEVFRWRSDNNEHFWSSR